MTDWSRLDWVMAAIVVLSVVSATLKGLTRQLISLGAVIWGVMMAIWFHEPVAGWLSRYVKTAEVAKLVAFLAILVAAMLVGVVIGGLASRLVKKSGLGWFDRLLGASFGLVRGVLVSWALILALVIFAPGKEWVERSRLAPYMSYGARVLVEVAPTELKQRFQAGWKEAKKAWDRRVPENSR